MSKKKKIRSFDDLFEILKNSLEKAKKIKEEAEKIKKEVGEIVESLEVERLTKNIDNPEVFEKKKRLKYDKAIDSFYETARPLLNTAQELQRKRGEIIKFLEFKEKKLKALSG